MSLPVRIDETGKVYNRLTVVSLEFVPEKRRHLWLCRCSCGSEKLAPGEGLRNGSYQSCGCLARENSVNNPKMVSTRDSSIANLLGQYKINCKRSTKQLNFDLTYNEFVDLISRDCGYCGKPPREIASRRKHVDSTRLMANGIDRIDSSLGYSITNCVPCCSECNLAKMDVSAGDFIRMCYSVVMLHEKRSKLYGGKYAN